MVSQWTAQYCDVQGIYNVLLWSRPDVLESIFNKVVSVKKRGREIHVSSLSRIIFKILLAFEQSPLSQEDNDSMKEMCICSYWCHCFSCLSCQGLLFIAPFTNVVGGRGWPRSYCISILLPKSKVVVTLESVAQQHTSLFDMLHF